MMPKLIVKSMKIHTFLKKAEKLETICFTIENVVLGTENCMKFQYKINVKLIKIKPKSMKIHTFLKKAEMLETNCFTIENVVLGT